MPANQDVFADSHIRDPGLFLRRSGRHTTFGIDPNEGRCCHDAIGKRCLFAALSRSPVLWSRSER